MPKTLPEYDIVLANTTMLKPLMSMRLLPKLTGPTGGDLHRYTFDTLERLARTEDAAGPRFVFAHLICPHPPHVIDRDGNVRESPARDAQEFSSMPLWRDHEGYLGQMEFCNRRVVDIVDALQASQREAILIVQADHGSASSFQAGSSAIKQPRLVRERTAILNAYLVPEAIRRRLAPDISPVNTFRIVLSELLGVRLDPLEDRVYFSWYDEPHRFFDVTEQVHIDARETPPEKPARTDSVQH